MFLAPKFFWRSDPANFLEWGYKIQPISDHVAKFQGDRARDLEERMAKQKQTSGTEYKPVRNGGLTITNEH